MKLKIIIKLTISIPMVEINTCYIVLGSAPYAL